MDRASFHWADYLVLAAMLSLSAAVGFYYACTGGKQKTTKEYLYADKNMHWFPVGCSLLASYMSSQTLLGLPGEVYSFGTVILLGYIFKPLGNWMGAGLFLPMFRQLQVVSVYKYVELRYGRLLKYLAVLIAFIRLILYSTLVIYGPALSISAVTGVNIWFAIISVAAIGILYTVLGGLKAVLWTDTLQLVIMVSGILFVLIYGMVNIGGFQHVWEVNKLSGRLDMLEPSKFLDFDPRMRHTIWGVALGNGLLPQISAYGLTQISVQRAMTLRTGKDMVLAYGIAGLGSVLFGVVCGLLGLLIFAADSKCDPLVAGDIDSKDQLYPLYVMKLLGHIPGVPGFILSSLFSGSLSTISSTMSALSGIFLQDVVLVLKPDLPDRHATIITKISALIIGGLSTVLVLFAKSFGSGVLSMGFTFAGSFGGPLFTVFLMGAYIPIVKEKAATIGSIFGLAYGTWTGFGGLINKPYIYEYPVTTAGCNMTDFSELANVSLPVYDPSTWNPQSHYRSGVSVMYDISYVWVGVGSATVTLIVSLILSVILARDDDKLIPKKLISPVMLNSHCLPKSWKNMIDFEDEPNSDSEVKELEEEENDSIAMVNKGYTDNEKYVSTSM